MNLPDKELYTENELAERWGTTVDKINQQVKAGKLKLFGRPRMSGLPLSQIPYELSGPRNELFYRREDIECFEKENEQKQKVVKSTKIITETEKQLIDRLKSEGQSDKVIAKELKARFPGIKNSRIGRLLPANPDANISNDAHRKRGERLTK